MSWILEPRGPLPPNVYHVRRLVVAVVAVGAVVGITGIVGSFAAGSKSPLPNATSGSTAGAVPECDPAAVTVSAVTDNASYGEGEKPQFSMTITNTSDVVCTIQAGTDKQKYVVTSGSDTIWDSTKCQKDPAPFVQEFQAGESITTNTLEWGVARSDNCESGTPAVGGGASYQLTVHLGDTVSAESAQFLLY
jgi:hypothetical protein